MNIELYTVGWRKPFVKPPLLFGSSDAHLELPLFFAKAGLRITSPAVYAAGLVFEERAGKLETG